MYMYVFSLTKFFLHCLSLVMIVGIYLVAVFNGFDLTYYGYYTFCFSCLSLLICL